MDIGPDEHEMNGIFANLLKWFIEKIWFKEWFVHELDTATSLMKHQGDLRWMSRVFCEWWLNFSLFLTKNGFRKLGILIYNFEASHLHNSLLSLYKASHEVGTTWEWAMFWWTIPSRNKHIILITHIRLTLSLFFKSMSPGNSKYLISYKNIRGILAWIATFSYQRV